MFLPQISKEIRDLLDDFLPEELANYPNVYGVYKQSELVFDISDGEGNNLINSPLVNLTLRISIATEKSTNEKGEYLQKNEDLETLISVIINKIRNRVIKNSQKIIFNKFQKFTPESGKHRALLEFTIPVYITDFLLEGNQDERRVKEVRIEYK